MTRLLWAYGPAIGLLLVGVALPLVLSQIITSIDQTTWHQRGRCVVKVHTSAHGLFKEGEITTTEFCQAPWRRTMKEGNR